MNDSNFLTGLVADWDNARSPDAVARLFTDLDDRYFDGRLVEAGFGIGCYA